MFSRSFGRLNNIIFPSNSRGWTSTTAVVAQKRSLPASQLADRRSPKRRRVYSAEQHDKDVFVNEVVAYFNSAVDHRDESTTKAELEREVSTKFNVPVRTLQRWVSRRRTEGTLERRRGSGRPRTYNSRHLKAVREANAALGLRGSARSITAIVNKEHGFGSERSIRRILADPELFDLRSPRFKPSITPEQKADRYAFAVRNEETDFSKAGDVVTVDVDECQVKCIPRGKLRVPVGEETPVEHVANLLHPASVMVFAAIGPENDDGTCKVFFKPIVKQVKAARNTTHRQKGVKYAKKLMMGAKEFEKVGIELADALREVYPNAKMVYIQMDNAEAHSGDDVIRKIEEKVNARGQLPQIEFVMQPAKSPDTNACDIALWPLLKSAVDKERALEKSAAYAAAVRDNADDDGDDDDDAGDAGSESGERPTVACGDKRLLRGVGEVLSKCVECHEYVEGTRSAKCDARGGWHCDECEHIPKRVTNNRGTYWACSSCKRVGCNADVPRRHADACVVCGTRDGCAACVDDDVLCAHWIRCKNGGHYHKSCAGVADDDDGVDFACRLCLAIKSAERRGSAASQTPIPVGEEAWRHMAIWHDNTDSLVGALHRAWDATPDESIQRIFETKNEILRCIAKEKGGNRYRNPHFRNRKN
jgi:hypothetical protein